MIEETLEENGNIMHIRNEDGDDIFSIIFRFRTSLNVKIPCFI